jgi:hypothetical protein
MSKDGDEFNQALKASGAQVLGKISLTEEQRQAIKKVTGISTTQLGVARSQDGQMVFGMPASW